jgi:uncharacterized protein (DUF697 family)
MFTHLLDTATDLVSVMNKEADDMLPKKIVEIIEFQSEDSITLDIIATAVIVSSIWAMYAKINKAIGLTLSKEVLKILATAIGQEVVSPLGGISRPQFIAPTLSSLDNAIAAYYCVSVSGIVYLKILTRLFKDAEIGFPDKVNLETLKVTVSEIVKKENIQEVKNLS